MYSAGYFNNVHNGGIAAAGGGAGLKINGAHNHKSRNRIRTTFPKAERKMWNATYVVPSKYYPLGPTPTSYFPKEMRSERTLALPRTERDTFSMRHMLQTPGPGYYEAEMEKFPSLSRFSASSPRNTVSSPPLNNQNKKTGDPASNADASQTSNAGNVGSVAALPNGSNNKDITASSSSAPSPQQPLSQTTTNNALVHSVSGKPTNDAGDQKPGSSSSTSFPQTHHQQQQQKQYPGRPTIYYPNYSASTPQTSKTCNLFSKSERFPESKRMLASLSPGPGTYKEINYPISEAHSNPKFFHKPNSSAFCDTNESTTASSLITDTSTSTARTRRLRIASKCGESLPGPGAYSPRQLSSGKKFDAFHFVPPNSVFVLPLEEVLAYASSSTSSAFSPSHGTSDSVTHHF